MTLMAKHCDTIDMTAIILGDKSTDDTELIKLYQSEFEKMAKITNGDGLTPFQVACIELKKHLQIANNSNHAVKDDLLNKDGLPKSIVRMLNFLYFECKSNPNELVAAMNNSYGNFQKYIGHEKSANGKSQEKMLVDEDEESSEEEDDDDDDEEESEVEEDLATKQQYFPAIFLLSCDKCVNILDNFLKKAKNQSDLAKIDLKLNDSYGRTFLIKSLIEKQSKVALKLLNTNALSNSVLVAQICKNEEKDLCENVLQLATRNLLNEVLMKLLQQFSQAKSNSSDVADFLELLQHQNAYGQNFLHLLAMMNATQRAHFNLDTLNAMRELIVPYFNENHSNKNILHRLLGTKDILGRTPLHLCFLYRTSTTSDISIEQFFMDNLREPGDSNESSKVKNLFHESDVFGLSLIHISQGIVR